MTSDKLDRPARRPPRSILSNLHLRLTVGDGMRPWEEALEDYLASQGRLRTE
jgi:dTDP-4-dehydrorhamnose reductase